MNFEFDQYFTPPTVAQQILKLVEVSGDSLVCVDPTCGSGNLLDAAEKIIGSKKSIGIDKDFNVIRKLKEAKPHWHLKTGDLFDRNLYSKNPNDIDLLLLNPPFSQQANKSIEIEYSGEVIRSSTAMACLLRSLELFRPKQGAILIAPESMLFSKIDEPGRQLLSKEFSIKELLTLSSSTFNGTRANSSAVRITTGVADNYVNDHKTIAHSLTIKIIRGGLQVHSFYEKNHGVPFIHSTALRSIIIDKVSSLTFPKTAWHGRGRIRGWCLLLPRVGIPNTSCVRAIYLKNEVQLSDCVIAITCCNRDTALSVEEKLTSSMESLLGLYKGTGARYVTISRLRNLLSELGIYDASSSAD